MPPTQPDTTTTSPPPTLAAALARVLLGFMLLITVAAALAWLGAQFVAHRTRAKPVVEAMLRLDRTPAG